MASQAFGLYIHIPYCLSKCPYCAFNSYALTGAQFPEERYLAAVVRELKSYLGSGDWHAQECQSIFFGGGTPSLFSAESIAKILAAVKTLAICSEHLEVTLEANPGTLREQLGLEKLCGFRAAGVNRLSLGVQSFNEEKLKFLGRIHSASDALHALELIAKAGFSRSNLDLIYGIHQEPLETWRHDLDIALGAETNHLSCYELSIEPGTEFSRQARRGVQHRTSAPRQVAFFEETRARLQNAGFEQYEISNFARSGEACRHNLCYWRGFDYLGIGAGAVSFASSSAVCAKPARWTNLPGPEEYIERIESKGTARQRIEELDADALRLEFFFLRLRMKDGFSFDDYRTTFDEDFLDSCGPVARQLSNAGLLDLTDTHARTTSRGFALADQLALEFCR